MVNDSSEGYLDLNYNLQLTETELDYLETLETLIILRRTLTKVTRPLNEDQDQDQEQQEQYQVY